MSFAKRFHDLEMWVEDRRDEFEAWLKRIFSPSMEDHHKRHPAEQTTIPVSRPKEPKPERIRPQLSENQEHVTREQVTQEEIDEMLRFYPNYPVRNKYLLYLVGSALTAVTMAGALLGYVRAYNRFMAPKGEEPTLYPLKPIVKYAMRWGAVLLPVLVAFILFILYLLIDSFHLKFSIILAWFVGNFLISVFVFSLFRHWQIEMSNTIAEAKKFGSARFANDEDLEDYKSEQGFYVGGDYTFSDKGHIITVAGTRGGKGTNLIIPNLLGKSNYQGSWVVIDPKGENAAITARYQREIGKKVVILNPWDLLVDHVGEAQSYNPLDILADISSIHLVDDAQIIAEMLVPINTNDHNSFFTDNARSIVTGLIMQIVTTEEGDDRTLTTLWRWARYSGDDWDGLIAKMRRSKDPVNGLIIQTIGNEIVKLMEAGEETFGSIISNVLQATDFLKSPALQKSLRSGYSPAELADGNTALYIIIPTDKLKSHSRWLRLLVTTTMRSVIRKPNKRVCFLLDEFAALGYLSEIENALSTYAGYEVTVWPILQSLIQLKHAYGDNWETFLANTAVKHYFAVNDNFSSDYISQAIGIATNVQTNKAWYGVESAESNQRPLVMPDEVRRGSADQIFAFFGSRPPIVFNKQPYYKMEDLEGRADINPYISKATAESVTLKNIAEDPDDGIQQI